MLTRVRASVGAVRAEIDSHLEPAHLRLVSAAVLVVVCLLTGLFFATSDKGRSVYGPPLGVDFAGFYVAGLMLDRGEAARLYDPALHNRLYHELLPNLPVTAAIPYVHPPFVAAAIRPLTHLPYEAAVATWMVISAGLFAGGAWLLIRSLPAVPREHRGLALLLAVTFHPFLLECWIGGQLSAVGFFAFALGWLALRRERPLLAGMALGLCFYKPTLLLLLLPMLVVGRRWRVLLGVAATGAGLAVVSLLLVGWQTCAGYLDVLLGFRGITSAGNVGFRTWKYVDFNNSLRLLLGQHSVAVNVCFVALALAAAAWLAKAWWYWPAADAGRRQWIWAATLALVPLVNVYYPYYDSVVVVQSVLLAADNVWRERRTARPLRDSGLARVALAVAGLAWFSQGLARATGVQVYTLALIGLAVYQMRQVSSSAARPSADVSLAPSS